MKTHLEKVQHALAAAREAQDVFWGACSDLQDLLECDVDCTGDLNEVSAEDLIADCREEESDE